MDSLSIQMLASVSGRVQGITGNAALRAIVNGTTFNMSLNSGSTAGQLADNGYSGTRTLGSSANETLDLRSFTNLLNEASQSLDKLKLFYVRHNVGSAASSISVGNSGSNALIIRGMFGTTTADLTPGESVIIEIPTTAGMVVDATHKDIKVTNNDGAEDASYLIGWFGE